MGRDHSVAPRAMAGVGSPRMYTASMIPCRSIAMEMARRTRTSLKGGITVHIRQEVLVHQVGMALLEGFQILLAYTPRAPPWATVDLPRAVHGQAGRGIIEDQPFHAIDVRLVLEEVVRMAFEHRLHIRLVAVQQAGTTPPDPPRFFYAPPR